MAVAIALFGTITQHFTCGWCDKYGHYLSSVPPTPYSQYLYLTVTTGYIAIVSQLNRAIRAQH